MGHAAFVADRAVDLLDASCEALSSGRTGYHRLNVRYVSHGPPAVAGCDDPTFTGQVTVHLQAGRAIWHRSLRGRDPIPQTHHLIAVATFVVQVWRCVPTSNATGGLPSADDLDLSARQLATDAWCLLTYLHRQHAEGTLFSEQGCSEVSFGDLRVLPPAGAMAGLEVTVDLVLADGGP